MEQVKRMSSTETIDQKLVRLSDRLKEEFKKREGLEATVTIHAQSPFEYIVVTQAAGYTAVHAVYRNQNGDWDFVRCIRI